MHDAVFDKIWVVVRCNMINRFDGAALVYCDIDQDRFPVSLL